MSTFSVYILAARYVWYELNGGISLTVSVARVKQPAIEVFGVMRYRDTKNEAVMQVKELK